MYKKLFKYVHSAYRINQRGGRKVDWKTVKTIKKLNPEFPLWAIEKCANFVNTN